MKDLRNTIMETCAMLAYSAAVATAWEVSAS